MLDHLLTKFIFICLFLFNISLISLAQTPLESRHTLRGITIEYLDKFSQQDLDDFKTNFIDKLNKPITIRIVFQNDKTPFDYVTRLQFLQDLNKDSVTGKGIVPKKINLMGMILDSFSLKDFEFNKNDRGTKTYTCDSWVNDGANYNKRIYCFTKALNENIDIWEVGNEVNGSWANEGKTTVDKIAYAIKIAQLQPKPRPTALTLVHQTKLNKCANDDINQMSVWADKYLFQKDNKIKQTDINYLLVSYYEDNCDLGQDALQNRRPGETETDAINRYWNDIFNEFARKYTSVSYVGYGEVGYSSDAKTGSNENDYSDNKSNLKECKVRDQSNVHDDSYYCYCNGENRVCQLKIDLLNKYYNLNISTPKFVGGYFWWTVQDDMRKNNDDTIGINFENELIKHLNCLPETECR